MHIIIVLQVWREISEMITCGLWYFTGTGMFENLMQWAQFILAILMFWLTDDDEYCTSQRHISAFALVISWHVFIMAYSKYPSLSFLRVSLGMVNTVCKTFSKYLITYSYLFVAFGCGFYIIFHQDHNTHGNVKVDNGDIFNQSSRALIKTMIMFIGEIDFGDLPVYNFLSYFYLLPFVFLIIVVLMNLLNGLAVSDIRIILNEAKIIGIQEEVDNIYKLEREQILWRKKLASKNCYNVNDVLLFKTLLKRKVLYIESHIFQKRFKFTNYFKTDYLNQYVEKGRENLMSLQASKTDKMKSLQEQMSIDKNELMEKLNKLEHDKAKDNAELMEKLVKLNNDNTELKNAIAVLIQKLSKLEKN